MEYNLFYFAGITFLLTLVGLLVFNILNVGYILLAYFFDFDSLSRQKLVRPDSKHVKLLEKYFPYYNQLNSKQKIQFAKRVKVFIGTKRFIPRNMEEVTLEQKVLISAAAIQLTFGLPGIFFSHFNTILVYPDTYYSNIFQRYHKGEVNMGGGLIVLSWKNFVEGYVDHKDGRNLGLHEMSHALRLENSIKNDEFEFIDHASFVDWAELAAVEINKIRNGQPSFFRAYAATNREEFFAVAVENFFEKPEEFYAYNSELYSTMTRFLNQDPRNLFNMSEKYSV